MSAPEEKLSYSKKKKVIIITTVASISLIVILVCFAMLNKIKREQAIQAGGQEQFESSPMISSQVQSDCQQSAVKIAEQKNSDQQIAEYKSNVESCKDVFFSLEENTYVRAEGMYPDLAVDIAVTLAKSEVNKAVEFLQYAKSLKAWDFYLGPVTCDSQHVIDAYLESMQLPNEKICIKTSEANTKLLLELKNKNFSLIPKMIANDQTIWMGLPESDVGCPEKISSVIKTLTQMSSGNIIIEPVNSADQTGPISFSIKSNGEEKATLIFIPKDECLQLTSVLIPNIETAE